MSNILSQDKTYYFSISYGNPKKPLVGAFIYSATDGNINLPKGETPVAGRFFILSKTTSGSSLSKSDQIRVFTSTHKLSALGIVISDIQYSKSSSVTALSNSAH